MNIFPVIHFLDEATALAEVDLAQRAGAQGVFLISHRGRDELLVEVARRAKLRHPSIKVDINLLSRGPLEAIGKALAAELDMVWADDMGVSSKGLTPTGQACVVAAQETELTLFASVAFKYQPTEADPAQAARLAREAGFVPTTSGEATGHAPSVEKIRTMSEAAGGVLGVASGMTPENIAQYAPYLSDVLVATGISLDEHHLDEARLRQLVALAATR